MTDESITIGYAWLDNRNQPADAIGAGGTDFADPRKVTEIMVGWVNANGGVNGRELVPFYRPYTSYSAEAMQAVCTDFTQDNDVYFVVVEDATPQLVECLSKAGVPALTPRPVSALDSRGFDRFRGFLYHTTGLDLTQTTLLTAQAHVAMGHVTQASTIGVVTFDDANYERAAKAFEAELARHGISVADTVYVDITGGDYGTAQLANTVLRFRQRGVDRVAFFEVNGVMWWQFTIAAEAQTYRPKYVLNPTSYAEFYTRSGLIDGRQAEGSRGVAIHLINHINRASEPHPPEGRVICREILDAAGMEAASEDNEGVSYHGPGHHTGAGTYFRTEYAGGCNCINLVEGIRKLPGTP